MFTLGIVSGPLYDRVRLSVDFLVTSADARLCDSILQGYFRSLLIVGSVLDVFCLFMVSLCKEFWQALLCQGLGQGFAMGLLFLPSISVLSQYFARRRALASESPAHNKLYSSVSLLTLSRLLQWELLLLGHLREASVSPSSLLGCSPLNRSTLRSAHVSCIGRLRFTRTI